MLWPGWPPAALWQPKQGVEESCEAPASHFGWQSAAKAVEAGPRAPSLLFPGGPDFKHPMGLIQSTSLRFDTLGIEDIVKKMCFSSSIVP